MEQSSTWTLNIELSLYHLYCNSHLAVAKEDVFIKGALQKQGGGECAWGPMGIASNEAEEAGASSLFCVRMYARIGDVL